MDKLKYINVKFIQIFLKMNIIENNDVDVGPQTISNGPFLNGTDLPFLSPIRGARSKLRPVYAGDRLLPK